MGVGVPPTDVGVGAPVTVGVIDRVGVTGTPGVFDTLGLAGTAAGDAGACSPATFCTTMMI